jgi:hypothetical protein
MGNVGYQLQRQLQISSAFSIDLPKQSHLTNESQRGSLTLKYNGNTDIDK